MLFLSYARGFCVCVCVCVCVIQDSHIRKYSEVFLHRFSHTGTPAASVIGLRRPPLAVWVNGCADDMCPYSVIRGKDTNNVFSDNKFRPFFPKKLPTFFPKGRQLLRKRAHPFSSKGGMNYRMNPPQAQISISHFIITRFIVMLLLKFGIRRMQRDYELFSYLCRK